MRIPLTSANTIVVAGTWLVETAATTIGEKPKALQTRRAPPEAGHDHKVRHGFHLFCRTSCPAP